MLLLTQLCMFTSLEDGCRRRRPLDSGLEKKGVGARVMSQDHSVLSYTALPGLKLLRVPATQAGGYDDALVVRE